jgi:hypothetical protein
MINEEDKNTECPEDRVECTSRQSCESLSDHACGDRPANLCKKYSGE